MSHLDEYIKDAEQNNLGNDLKKEIQKKAKKQVKKPIRKVMNRLKKRIMDALGITKLKKMAKQGAKKVLKAGMRAAGAALKSFVTFLVSNPVGWVVGIVLIAGGVALAANLSEEDGKEIAALLGDSPQEEGTVGGLSKEEIAVLMSDCPELVKKESGAVDEDAMMLKNAQSIFSVFKSYGLSDECISGILGNMSVEGGIDPTAMEAIYDEPQQMGPKKTEANADLDAHTQNVVFPAYASAGVSINKDAYRADDGKYYCGLGLVQWTGPGAYQMISVGKSTGAQWYQMEYQLAYMLSDAHYRPGFFADWKKNPSSSPSDAALFFAAKYEGNTIMAQDERCAAAQDWYEKMASWEVNDAYYQSVLALSNSMGGVASDDDIGNRADNCGTNDAYNNSSMASAAVSYAYATQEQGNGNNGTSLYQTVHDNIFPGDPHYMSCDRSVACAVRWSGSDDEFPAGPTGTQLSYLMSSPKWKNLGDSASVTMDQLQPGDIFCLDGHIFMYTGKELIQQIHGSAAAESSDSVSGSFEERSPGCGNDATDIIVNRNGQDWIGRGTYQIFRCVQPDQSDTYKNAGSSSAVTP